MNTAWTLVALLAVGTEPLEAGDHTRTLEVDGISRSYLVHVPASYDGKDALPVVLIFHGGGSNAPQMVLYSGLNDKADQAGFIAVYPNGTGRVERVLTFNGGNCCGYAMRQDIDDVGFVRLLLDDLAAVVRVDPKRVYATGMSNGAIIAYRLASELSDKIAAIAPVAGPMGTESCQPKRAVPVMHFHGTDDEFAPFEGGRGPRGVSGTNFYSVEHSIQAWVKANGCQSEPAVTQEPDRADDGMTVTRKTYSSGRDGAEVVLLVVEGSGHTWPGRPSRAEFLGKTTRDISANDLMWEFFQRHPMP